MVSSVVLNALPASTRRFLLGDWPNLTTFLGNGGAVTTTSPASGINPESEWSLNINIPRTQTAIRWDINSSTATEPNAAFTLDFSRLGRVAFGGNPGDTLFSDPDFSPGFRLANTSASQQNYFIGSVGVPDTAPLVSEAIIRQGPPIADINDVDLVTLLNTPTTRWDFLGITLTTDGAGTVLEQTLTTTQQRITPQQETLPDRVDIVTGALRQIDGTGLSVLPGSSANANGGGNTGPGLLAPQNAPLTGRLTAQNNVAGLRDGRDALVGLFDLDFGGVNDSLLGENTGLRPIGTSAAGSVVAATRDVLNRPDNLANKSSALGLSQNNRPGTASPSVLIPSLANPTPGTNPFARDAQQGILQATFSRGIQSGLQSAAASLTSTAGRNDMPLMGLLGADGVRSVPLDTHTGGGYGGLPMNFGQSSQQPDDERQRQQSAQLTTTGLSNGATPRDLDATLKKPLFMMA